MTGIFRLAERAVTALETIARELEKLNEVLDRHSYYTRRGKEQFWAFNVCIDGDVKLNEPVAVEISGT